ncbi:hypothetical protein KM043_010395 [Ampulex compressa]|nr:hypothetical protein KM043_010395 [Ampulex compressa]
MEHSYSGTETRSKKFQDKLNPTQRSKKRIPENKQAASTFNTEYQCLGETNKILSILLDVLREQCSQSCYPTIPNKITTIYNPTWTTTSFKDTDNKVNISKYAGKRQHPVNIKGTRFESQHRLIDLPNLINGKEETPNGYDFLRKGCGAKKFCSSVRDKSSRDKFRGKENLADKSVEPQDCTCGEGKRCYSIYRGSRRCCEKCSERSLIMCASNDVSLQQADGDLNEAKNIDAPLRDLDLDSQGYTKRTTKLTKEVSVCSFNCMNSCPDIRSNTLDSFPLLIADNEGLMEIHILSLQLSSYALRILFRENDASDVSLFLSWDIPDQETTRTFAMRYPQLNFDSSFVYRITDLFSFFDRVLSESLIFRVNVIQDRSGGYTIARARLCIKDILDYPQNKLHYVAPTNCILPCYMGVSFGQVSLWVRLSCNLDKLEAFKTTHGLESRADQEDFDSEASSLPKEIELAEDTADSSIQDFMMLKKARNVTEDPSKDVLTSLNKSETLPRTSDSPGQPSMVQSSLILVKAADKQPDTQESICEIFEESPKEEAPVGADRAADDEHETSDEDLDKDEKGTTREAETTGAGEKAKDDKGAQAETSSIAEFNALLSDTKNADLKAAASSSTIRDVSEVFSDKNWEEYRRRTLLAATSARSMTKDSVSNATNKSSIDRPLERDTIAIEIVNIMLFHKSTVMKDDDVKMLYIEYSFLGHRGASMETISVEKPKSPNQKLVYHFKKKFRIDEESHGIERSTLRAMLDESINPNIRFTIVSEPLPEETHFKECVEVGFANFNIREYALGDGHKAVSLPIMNEAQKEQIGVMKIFVLGLDAIRQCLGDEM